MVHTYSLHGYNIAMDVESGAVHILDNLPYEILCRLDCIVSDKCPESIVDELSSSYAVTDIADAYSELYGLYKDGMLFYERDYDITLEDTYPIKALCLHISHDCNMRCKYCFAEGGDFACGRKTMPAEVAKKAIDFIVEKSGGRKNIEVDLFGGEPLMNFETVRECVAYAHSIEEKAGKRFRFTLTTNGILLNDEVIEYLNREMDNVVLSLDGRKEVNDAVRIRTSKLGSYDAIVPKFQKLVSLRGDKKYYVRGTFTAKNLDFAADVMHIRSLGFEQVSVEPVVLEKGNPLALTDSMADAICSEYERLADEILKMRASGEFINFFHFMIDLEQGPCVVKRVKGCGAGSEYVAVTPDGDIYPCHRFVGMDDFKMGNVMESFAVDEEIRKRFSAVSLLSKPECKDCFAKYYCSGGCSANNFNENGDILKPHHMSCVLERKRLECAIMLKAAEACAE